MPESVDPKSILLLQYSPTCYHNPIFDRYKSHNHIDNSDNYKSHSHIDSSQVSGQAGPWPGSSQC